MLVPALIAWVFILGGATVRVPLPSQDGVYLPSQFQREIEKEIQPHSDHQGSLFSLQFRPISRKFQDLEEHPIKEESKVLAAAGSNEEGDGKFFEGNNEKNHHDQKHWQQAAKKGEATSENSKKDYNEEVGHSDKHQKERNHQTEYQKSRGVKEGESFQEGKKAAKKKQYKGFHNSHKKDEKKEIDSFYSNGHEEGEIKHFGKHSQQHKKENFVKKGGKWFKMAEKSGEGAKEGKNEKNVDAKEDQRFESGGGTDKTYSREQNFQAEKPKLIFAK